MLLEKIGDGDELVRLRPPFTADCDLTVSEMTRYTAASFAFHGVDRVGRVLTEEGGDVPAHRLRRRLGKFRRQAAEPIRTRRVFACPSRFLDIAANVLHPVALEQLLVVLPELKVGDDDGLAHLAKGIPPAKSE